MTPGETQALKQPAPGPRPLMTSFVEHLVRNKIITQETALAASNWKRQNERDKRSLTDILREEFSVPADVLQTQVAQFYAFRVIDPNDHSTRRLLNSDVNRIVRGLPEPVRQLALRHKVLPYDVAENQPDKIIIVTPNPSDREVSDVVRALPYKKFEICFMRERDWTDYWRQVTMDKPDPKPVPRAVETTSEEEESDFEGAIDREIARGQLPALVENVLADAVRVGATDVHLLPRAARKTDVFFRIDGVLSLWYSIDDARAEAVAAVLKSRIVTLDRYEHMAAQEGSTQKVIDSQNVRFRMSVLPVIARDPASRFESVSIQVLREPDGLMRIDSIGLDPYSLKVFKEALALPRGLIILTGPEQSGRSTTMTAAMRSVMKPSVNVVTLEDPVRCILEGACQIKLTHKLNFEDALNAILRHDPDVIMLGEIRDRKTAELALRLSLTGHRVFAVVHAHDTVGALQRLHGMGVEPYLLAFGVTFVGTQRLMRRLCDRCKEHSPSQNTHLLSRIGMPEENIQLYKAGSCIDCIGGFKGRIPVFESLLVSQEMRDIILEAREKFPASAVRDAAGRQGMQSLAANAVEFLRKGMITIEELTGALA